MEKEAKVLLRWRWNLVIGNSVVPFRMLCTKQWSVTVGLRVLGAKVARMVASLAEKVVEKEKRVNPSMRSLEMIGTKARAGVTVVARTIGARVKVRIRARRIMENSGASGIDSLGLKL